MKILHTADWHIGQFKGPVVDGVNLRSQDTVKCLEYMVQVAIEEKPDIVCVSGDIFHQEQVGPVRYSDEMITATLYNASGCKDKTAHDAICSASKPQTQVFRSDWTRRDNEADMFVKMVKRLAKGFNFKLCDRIRFEDPETGKKYL